MDDLNLEELRKDFKTSFFAGEIDRLNKEKGARERRRTGSNRGAIGRRHRDFPSKNSFGLSTEPSPGHKFA